MLSKYRGDLFTAHVSFLHQGPAIALDVGVGFAGTGLSPSVDQWFVRSVNTAKDHSPTLYAVTINEAIPADMAFGKKDILKWVQGAGGARDRRGEGFFVADWDKVVYEIIDRSSGGVPGTPPGDTGFDSLLCSWSVPLKSRVTRDTPILVTESFYYRGPAVRLQVGIGIAPHRGIWGHHAVSDFDVAIVDVPSYYERTLVSVRYYITLPKGMSLGMKDTLKLIQQDGLGLDPGGDGYILADWDDDVFEVV